MKFSAAFLCSVLWCIAITCEAKPFFNPFNVAIKTDFGGEEGNTLSFVYPKNSYKLNLNVETKKLNQHEFNIGQLFSHVTRSIGKNLSFLNPFKLSSGFGGLKTTTTSTTEANFDFSSEVTEDSKAPSIDSGKGDSNEETDSVTENFDVRIIDDSTTKKIPQNQGGFGYIPPSIPSNKYVPPNSGYLPSNLRKRHH